MEHFNAWQPKLNGSFYKMYYAMMLVNQKRRLTANLYITNNKLDQGQAFNVTFYRSHCPTKIDEILLKG